MITTLNLKRGSVVVVEPRNILSDDKAEKLLEELQEIFPYNKVLLPNGAKLVILETET